MRCSELLRASQPVLSTAFAPSHLRPRTSCTALRISLSTTRHKLPMRRLSRTKRPTKRRLTLQWTCPSTWSQKSAS